MGGGLQMEWLRRMSLRTSLFVIIITSGAIGVGFVFLASLVIGSIATRGTEANCLCQSPLSFLAWILPIVASVVFTILAATTFYKVKLKTPLSQLNIGIKRIMENDLDFSIKFSSEDELGRLCESFEFMRVELLKSNRELWQQMEERKRLNVAFAHDLRNPVTVLKGSAMILKNGLKQGNLTIESAGESISLITQYTERIENYIQAMTSVQKLDELTFSPKEVDYFVLVRELENSLSILGSNAGKELHVFSNGDNKRISVDKSMIYTVAENLVSNALRYSKNNITVNLSCGNEKVVLCVSDDGCGFSGVVLKKGIAPFLRDNNAPQGQNFGIGLYISRLLCEKHNGTLAIENDLNGAKVTATFFGRLKNER